MPVSVICLECLSLYLPVFKRVCLCQAQGMIAYAHAEANAIVRACVFVRASARVCGQIGSGPTFNLVFGPLIIPPFTNWKIAN